MTKFLAAALLVGSLSGCRTLQPRVVDSIDAFTGVPSRSLYITYSDQVILANAMSGKTSPLLPLDRSLDMVASQGDTVLTFGRYLPEHHYDVPATGNLLILTERSAEPIALPLLKPYHTIGGPLLVKARVNRSVMRQLQASPVMAIRIERVVDNEADPEPVSWYLYKEYSKAFFKGVSLFLTPPKPSRTARKGKTYF